MIRDINSFEPIRRGNHASFISSEKGCVHVGKNIGRCMVRQFKMDGGVVPEGSAESRCDYLLLNDDAKTSYFIELKGSDIPKAIEQIESSVQAVMPSLPGYTVFRRIVYKSGTHKIKESQVIAWQKKHGRSAQIKERKLEENI